MTKDEAMKLALEAMERYQVKRQDFDRFAEEITALREALAEQPAQQEPVAKYMGKTYRCPIVNLYQDIPVGTLLYTTPAQRTWVGLTDDEKRQLFERKDYQGWLDYINAIEAKLMEKNT